MRLTSLNGCGETRGVVKFLEFLLGAVETVILALLGHEFVVGPDLHRSSGFKDHYLVRMLH